MRRYSFFFWSWQAWLLAIVLLAAFGLAFHYADTHGWIEHRPYVSPRE